MTNETSVSSTAHHDSSNNSTATILSPKMPANSTTERASLGDGPFESLPDHPQDNDASGQKDAFDEEADTWGGSDPV